MKAPRYLFPLVGLVGLGHALGELIELSRLMKTKENVLEVENVEFMASDDEPAQSSFPPCSICMSNISHPTATVCGHIFCWECIEEWCRNGVGCPTCRTRCYPRDLLVLMHYAASNGSKPIWSRPIHFS